MLSILLGTFGITKGMVLVRHAGDSTFELVTYQHLDLPTIESISQQLHADIQDDLEEVDGLVELSLSPQSPATPTTLRALMANVGMRTIIVCRVQEKMPMVIDFFCGIIFRSKRRTFIFLKPIRKCTLF